MLNRILEIFKELFAPPFQHYNQYPISDEEANELYKLIEELK